MSLARLYVAMDNTDLPEARQVAEQLAGIDGVGLKIGKEFFTAHGPQGVKQVLEGTGLSLFLDLKFHDIPNTVAGGIRSALPLSPDLITIHASGGRDMMQAAAEAARSNGETGRPRIIGVTMLTSLDARDLEEIGYAHGVLDSVKSLASLAQDSGLDGLVCSAADLDVVRTTVGEDFVLVTPGIRPFGAPAGDQKRVVTPADAVAAGATALVVGRPIMHAEDKAAAARSILATMGHAPA